MIHFKLFESFAVFGFLMPRYRYWGIVSWGIVTGCIVTGLLLLGVS